MDVSAPAARSAPVSLRNVPLPEPHLLGIAAGMVLHRVRPWTLLGPHHVHRLVGYSLIVSGTWVVGRSLHTAGSTDVEHPDRLLITGPYALTRNPMYIGWALLHLGIGVAAGHAWILAALPGATAWAHREILREERKLSENFGDEYERYRATVPRYLPRWRRWRVCR